MKRWTLTKRKCCFKSGGNDVKRDENTERKIRQAAWNVIGALHEHGVADDPRGRQVGVRGKLCGRGIASMTAPNLTANAFTKAAGEPPPDAVTFGARRWWTAAQLDELARLWREGWSADYIARKLLIANGSPGVRRLIAHLRDVPGAPCFPRRPQRFEPRDGRKPAARREKSRRVKEGTDGRLPAGPFVPAADRRERRRQELEAIAAHERTHGVTRLPGYDQNAAPWATRL